jgi:nitrogenase iron protein NifH
MDESVRALTRLNIPIFHPLTVYIAQAVAEFKGRGYAQLKGLILNARGIANESVIVRAAAEELDTVVITEIPRDPTIQICESLNVTVIEGAPDSALAERYRLLARSIAE